MLHFFLRDYPEYSSSNFIRYINDCIGHNWMMTDQYQQYLHELIQTPLSPSIFTDKQLFYLKTCSFSLSSYLFATTELLACLTHVTIFVSACCWWDGKKGNLVRLYRW